MKHKFKINILIVFSITNILITSCSNNPQAGCFQEDDRKIVGTVENISGTIIEPDACGFVIEPDENLENNPLRLLRPCNLSEEFKVNGTNVLFSGFIYESFETEDICADFFEITEIKFDNP